MKIQKQTLLEALEAVLPVVHPNPVLPITAMIFFTDEWVWATNLESSLAVKNTTGITGVAVPAETAKFLRLCGEDVNVEIVTSGASITMKVVSGKFNATFECESLENAPRMPSFKEGVDFLPDMKTLSQFADKDDSKNTRFIFISDGASYASDRSSMVCHAHGGGGKFHLSLGQAKLIQSTSMLKYLQEGDAVFLSSTTTFMHTTFDSGIQEVPFKMVLDLNLGKSTGLVEAGNAGDVKSIADLSMMFPHMAIFEYKDTSCTSWSFDKKYSMEIEWGLSGMNAIVAYNASALKTATSICKMVHTGVSQKVNGDDLPSLLFTNEKYSFLITPSQVAQ